MYYWREQTKVMAKQARAEVLWSHQLEFFVRRANFNARTALAYTPTAPKYAKEHINRARVAYSSIASISSALLYGDEASGTRTALQNYPAVKKLFSNYACADNGGFYYSIAECEAFNNGILAKTGLLGAVQDYLNLVKANADRAAQFPNAQADLKSGAPLLMQQYGECSASGGKRQLLSVGRTSS